MGATVVDSSVSSANWNKQKPNGYDSKDLDKAIPALIEEMNGGKE